MAYLIEQIKSHFSPVFIENTCHSLDEAPDAIGKSIHGTAAALLASVIAACENPDKAEKIYEFLKQDTPQNLPELSVLMQQGNLAHNDPRETGSRLFTLSLGQRTPALIQSIAAFSGAKSACVSKLSGLVGAVAVQVLGNIVRREQLSPSGFANLLAAERRYVYGLVPGNAAPVVGLSQASLELNPADSERSTDLKWAGALALLLLMAVGLFLLAKYMF